MMERLTDPGYIPEIVVSNMSNEQLANLYKKLCCYESTEIEPNQICEIMAHNTALIERLADYDQMEEEGLLYCLPCKIGDIVYQLDKRKNNITPKKVSQIELIISKSGLHCLITFEIAGCCRMSDFGKTVFLSKTAAVHAFSGNSNRDDYS